MDKPTRVDSAFLPAPPAAAKLLTMFMAAAGHVQAARTRILANVSFEVPLLVVVFELLLVADALLKEESEALKLPRSDLLALISHAFGFADEPVRIGLYEKLPFDVRVPTTVWQERFRENARLRQDLADAPPDEARAALARLTRFAVDYVGEALEHIVNLPPASVE